VCWLAIAGLDLFALVLFTCHSPCIAACRCHPHAHCCFQVPPGVALLTLMVEVCADKGELAAVILAPQPGTTCGQAAIGHAGSPRHMSRVYMRWICCELYCRAGTLTVLLQAALLHTLTE
jgi:hypothetical protein